MLALLFAACSARPGYAQSSPSDLRHEVLTTWTTEQGLPQNFIRTLAQTPDGFLWVGTLNGLVRFDGLRFRGFSKDDPSDLQDSIGALVRDSGDGLWIATNTGLLHYEHHRFQRVALAGKQRFSIQALAGATDGGLWVYADGVLARTRGDALQLASLPKEAGEPRDLAQTTDGTLWLSDGQGVFAIPPHGAATKYPQPGVRLLYADPFGALYAGDGHTLYRFNGRRFAVVHDPGLGNFVDVLVDREHRLWLASGGLHGLSRSDGLHKEVLTMADGLASNDVRTIFEDSQGDIWIATIAGLQRLHHGLFTTYTAANGLPTGQSQIDAVFAQANGTVWAGTLEGGIAGLRNGRWTHYDKAQGISTGQVRAFIENGETPAVAVSDYGIFELRGKRFAKLPDIPHGYVNNPVTLIDGSMWFSLVRQSGVYRRVNHQVTRYGAAEGLSDDSVWCLSADPHGVLWVGTPKHLLRWNGTRFENKAATPSAVLSVAWPSGGLAIGMLHGLLLQTTGPGRVLTQDEGLPGNTVLDLAGDAGGNLWIVTTSAIARVARRQWIDFAEGRANRIVPELFTEADGLKSHDVLPNNQVTMARGLDGRFWFATSRGLSVVTPLWAPEPAPRPVIDAITVDDVMHPGGDLTVGPGRHRMTFAYTAPGSIAPEQIRFRYRLSGWDRDWIDAGTSREVSYTGLPPGQYRFEVSATNREGAESRQIAETAVELRPFFWQTKWFLALVIIVAVGLIVEITRRRTRARAERLSLRFQERAAERERIAYQIHDTVIQDMIGATLQLELLGFQISDQPQTAERSLGVLAGRMRETIARSRNMISSLHSTAVVQYSLIDVLQHAEAEFRLGEMPHFELVSEGKPRQVHPLVRDEVYRICREAIANAFRHSNAEHVTVTVRFLPDTLEVEIADDGQGMDEETRLRGRAGHFGLRGMQAHAQRIGATVEIDSTPQTGTIVQLRVKTKQSAWRLWRAGSRIRDVEDSTAGDKANG